MTLDAASAPARAAAPSLEWVAESDRGVPMPLWLNDLLRDESLGLELIAGADGVADRGPIRWAHSSDAPDPTPWLEGGELLLTTGLGVQDDAEAQRALIARLDERGVAAVGFGVGVVLDDVPAAMVAAAEERSLPLFTVPYEVPFIAVTRRVAHATFEEHYATLRSAVDVHRQVLGSVVAGSGVGGVLEVVAKELPELGLVVFDYFGEVLDRRDPGGVLEDLGPEEIWAAVRELAGGRDGSAAELGDRQVTASVARLGDQVEAVLATVSSRPLLEHESLLAQQALAGVSLELARGLSVREARRARVAELLEDVATGHASRELVRRQLHRLGTDPGSTYRVLCVDASSDLVGPRVCAVVEEVLAGSGVVSVGRYDGRVFALLQGGDGDEPGRVLEGARLRGLDQVRVGRSQAHDAASLRAAIREATVAAARAAAGAAVDVTELGVSGLLAGLADDEGAATFVEQVLGPVLAHERDETTPLLETLRAYLAHGCRPGPAADQLGVHRHTLTYRLERIHELTGNDPRDGAHLLAYTLALELLDRRPELP